MRIKYFLYLIVLFSVVGCAKEDTRTEEKLTTKVSHSASFKAIICDQSVDIDCEEVASKMPAANVQIYLFESVEARILGQQIVTEGVTDINGYVGFSGLEAKTYFYSAFYPNPDEVKNVLEEYHIRISSNTPSVNEEIIFLR
jgi:hypothetical protein